MGNAFVQEGVNPRPSQAPWAALVAEPTRALTASMRRRALRGAWIACLALCALSPAQAQPVGHLGVPGLQMIRSGFASVSGLPPSHYYLLNVTHPDGSVDTLNSAYLLKQTLVYTELVLILYRNSASVLSGPETGEIYLGEVDASQKSQPVQDQMALLRFTIPPNETRLIVRIPLPAGRAFSAYRQPVILNFASAGVSLNARAHGYLLPH